MLDLPTELWQHIFKAAHSTAVRSFDQDSLNAFNMEITLGCVCRHWREVAHGTPDLWTIITLFPVKSGRLLMEMYISRSASLPLSLRMDFGRAETDLSEVWALYCTIADRIAQLSIRHLEMGPTYLDFWQRSNCITLSKLKTLIVPCMTPNVLLHLLEAIHAPDLHTVAITSFMHSPSQPWHPIYHNLPIDRLYLAYEALEPTTDFQVPESCMNLFSKVQDLGFIGTTRATSFAALSAVIHHLALIFPNTTSLYTNIRMSTLHATFSASTQFLWPDLHYISFLQDVPTSASSTLALALQESRARQGRPIQNIHLAGTRQRNCPPPQRAQDVHLDWW